MRVSWSDACLALFNARPAPPAAKPAVELARAEDAVASRGGFARAETFDAHGKLRFPMPPLHPAEAAELEGLHSYVTEGHGVLEGTLELREPVAPSKMPTARQTRVPVLVTYGGQRVEVGFQLDLPLRRAESLDGHRVRVEADFRRSDAWGTGTGAKIALVLGKAKLESGERARMRGEVRHLAPLSEGGSPEGRYLVLSKPLCVDGERVSEVLLEGGEALSVGQVIEIERPVRLDTSGVGIPFARTTMREEDLVSLHRVGDPPRDLTEEELMLVSGPYIGSLRGIGTLQGVLHHEPGQSVPTRLVTSKVGQFETSFALDLDPAAAAALHGRTVQVSGTVHRGIATGGPRDRVSEAQITRTLEPEPNHSAGARITVAGIAYQRTRLGGDARFSFTELILPRPIRVEGRRVQILEIPEIPRVEDKTKLRLEGSIALRRVVDSGGRERTLVELEQIQDPRPATDVPMFYADTETLVNDFEWASAEGFSPVVPKP